MLIQTKGRDANGKAESGLGSGVVVSERGDILTSLHVVAGADSIALTFADGTEAVAQVTTAQPENDIAVLRPSKLPNPLVPATLGNPGSMHVGDEAFVVGNPLGLYSSMSAGVISGFDRSFRVPDGQRELHGLIQIDAAREPRQLGRPAPQPRRLRDRHRHRPRKPHRSKRIHRHRLRRTHRRRRRRRWRTALLSQNGGAGELGSPASTPTGVRKTGARGNLVPPHPTQQGYGATPHKKRKPVNQYRNPANAPAMERVLYEVKKVIVGQDHLLERLIVALLARGHMLVEGVPGLAKTMTIKTVAEAIGGEFKRIQFTPDLVPADLVGTRIYNQKSGEFNVAFGPVFTNLLLADEINRAPAKVQSALLEVMQERQVTIGRETFPVPNPFLVLATQNPIETEGTYALPEAQVDRFMLKVLVGYPTATEEFVIVERMTGALQAVQKVLTTDELLNLQREAAAVYVDPALIEYAIKLVTATRDPHTGWPEGPGPLHHVRREPARLDQPDLGGAGAGVCARAGLRAAARRARSRA